MESVDEELHQGFLTDPPNHSLNFNNLLEDANPERPFLFQLQQHQPKEDHRPNPPDHDNQICWALSLRNIEVFLATRQKQDQIRQIPEQFDQEQPEDDPLDFDLLPKKQSSDPQTPPKHLPILSKTSYLQQTRQEKIDRYLYKKERRVWNRKISYTCRKVVADKRQRKNGRFVKKEERNLSNLNLVGSSTKKSSKEQGEADGRQFLLQFKIEDYCQ